MVNTTEIELAIANHFCYRSNIIVPNVFWGMGLNYEADIVVLRPSGLAVEIEIKISKAGIKADLKKAVQHNSRLFKELWFAVPMELSTDLNIPAHAGILAVTKSFVKRVRLPKRRSDAIVWDNTRRQKLLELGVMRIWGLKENLNSFKNRRRTEGNP